jgi:hypothetical protein
LTLEEFLKQEEEAGEFESTGEFSVSLEDAIDKMVKYRYTDPTFFVLRLLQSAAVLGARSVQIETGLDQFSLKFSLDEPGRYGELAILLKGLTQPDHSSDANGYLVAGLQAALPFIKHGFEWSHLRGIRKESIIWNQEGCQVLRRFNAHASPNRSEFRFRQTREIRRVKFLAKFWGFLRSGEGEALVDPKTLRPRISPAPIDITMNKQSIPHLGWEGIGLLQLAPRKILDVGFWVVRRLDGCQVYLDPEGQPTATLPPGETLRCSHYFRESEQGTGSRIHWVTDGIVVETEEIAGETFEVEGWITTTGLQTDLSGFKVVKNENHSERLEQAIRSAKQHLAPRRDEWHEEHEGGYQDTDLL